jgi:hypothetical protein
VSSRFNFIQDRPPLRRKHLRVSSENSPEEQIFDYGLNFIRVRLFTIPGLSTLAPFGGKNRQIMVDVDPKALAARKLSPQDVVNALQSSDVIIPTATARIGNLEYDQDVVNLRPAVIAYSDGIHVRPASGVNEGERVAVNPGTGIVEGAKVRPVKEDEK